MITKKHRKEIINIDKNILISLPILFVLSLGVLTSCATYNLERKLEKKLDPESKEFYSKARFIITKQERKIFLRLPPEKRDEFIEEFWRRRDPDPLTEINEFKDQYFRRIEEANRLFKGVRPGWLQDRGRVYILVGPPDSRLQYPIGKYSRPHEVWHYGFFPVFFIDRNQSGEYELTPLSATNLAEITKAQSLEGKPAYGPGSPDSAKAFLDFHIQLKRGSEDEVLIHVDIPYQNIWLEEKEEKFETTLELTVEIFDSESQKVEEIKKESNVSLTGEEFKKAGNYPIEFPVALEKGKYTFQFTLFNKTGEGIREKKIEAEI